jgi:hypothetical protein
MTVFFGYSSVLMSASKVLRCSTFIPHVLSRLTTRNRDKPSQQHYWSRTASLCYAAEDIEGVVSTSNEERCIVLMHAGSLHKVGYDTDLDSLCQLVISSGGLGKSGACQSFDWPVLFHRWAGASRVKMSPTF